MFMRKAKGISLFSGGLDSQLAVCVLREAGAEMEAVTFETPFFPADEARRYAALINVPLTVVDFTADEIALVKAPPHGFGGAMNPCIDCHATMIKRAGEIMLERGFDFVSTGEVVNQRPMSQNRQAISTVEKSSGLVGRLLRPLSALLLEPTIPEQEGLVDRSRLYGISGRQRQTQMDLAARFGITSYPSPAGGCKLTEKGFSRKLKDLLDHEGLDDRRLVEMLSRARRFRLADGTSVILGRDVADNRFLEGVARPEETLVAPVSVPGPTALLPAVKSPADLTAALSLVAAYSRFDKFDGEILVKVIANGSRAEIPVPRPYDRAPFAQYQILA